MYLIRNCNNPREWVLDWLENRFQTTRRCLEESKSLHDCTMFDTVDALIMEYEAEQSFDCTVPDGTFADCGTVDELVAALEKVLENEQKKESES